MAQVEVPMSKSAQPGEAEANGFSSTPAAVAVVYDVETRGGRPMSDDVKLTPEQLAEAYALVDADHKSMTEEEMIAQYSGPTRPVEELLLKVQQYVDAVRERETRPGAGRG
jgi:fructose-specific phosphotransferase system component IIB